MDINTLHKNLVAYYKLNGNGINEVDPTDSIELVGSTNSFNGVGFNASCYNNIGTSNNTMGRSTKIYDLSNDLTMSCWFKGNDASILSQNIFGNHAWGYDPSISNSRHNFNIGINSLGNLLIYLNDGSSAIGISRIILDISLYYNTRWNHVVFSYNSDTKMLRRYFNGKFITYSILSENPATIPAPLTIGSFSDGYIYGTAYNGRIQNFKVWDRVLSDEEVKFEHYLFNTSNLDNNMLLAHWPLNGNGNDITGNGYDLTLYGSDSDNNFNGSGINSSCYSFMPTDISQYTPNRGSYTNKQMILDNDQTWMCWFMPHDPSTKIGYNTANPISTGAFRGILSNLAFRESIDAFYEQRKNFSINAVEDNIIIVGGKLSVDTSTNAYTYVNKNDICILNQWTHVAMSYSASTNTMLTYINGILIDTSTFAITPMFKENQFYIGVWSKNYALYSWMGKIQNAKVYTRVLSQNEIKKEYDSINGDNIKNGLVAWYKSNEFGKDLTGNGFDLICSSNGYSNFNGEGLIGKCYESTHIDNTNYYRAYSDKKLYLNDGQTWAGWIYVKSNPSIGPQAAGGSFFGNHEYGKLTPTSRENLGPLISNVASNPFNIQVYGGSIDSSNITYRTNNTPFNIGKWHHFAYSFDNSKMKIYVDGSLNAIRNVSYVHKYTPASISLGMWGDYGYMLDGKLDDVRIYNRVLSDQEIYNLSKAKILHYKFDQPIEMTNNIFPDPYGLTVNDISTKWDRYGKGTGNLIDSSVLLKYDSNNQPYINWQFKRNQPSTNWNWSAFWIPLSNIEMYKPYTLSFDFRLNSFTDVSDNINFRLARYKNDFTSGAVTINIYPASNPSIYNYINNWQRITLTRYFEPSSLYHDGSTYVQTTPFFEMYTTHGSSQSRIDFDIRNIQLEQCSVATTFNPSNNYNNLKVIRDYSDYGHDASLVSYASPQWNPSSKIGKGCYNFNCVNNNGKTVLPYSDINSGTHIRCTNFTDFPNNDTFTINYWNKNSGLGYQGGSYINLIPKDSSYMYGLSSYDSKYKIFGIDSSILGNISNFYDSNLGKWEMNTIVFNRKDVSSFKHYINGVLTYYTVTDVSFLEIPIMNNNDKQLTIGYSFAGGIPRFFTGSFADIRMYATALTQEDINRLYQTRASLDDTGNLNIENIVETGYVPSLIDYSNWDVSTIGRTGWSLNGSKYNNKIVADINPWGRKDIMWQGSNIYGSSTGLLADPDGGFISPIFNIDKNYKYRYSVWTKVKDVDISLGSENGYVFFGPLYGGDINFSILSLDTNIPIINPYFFAYKRNEFTKDKWILNVGYIYPNSYTGIICDPCSGCYTNDDGNINSSLNFRLTANIVNYKFDSSTIYQRLRASNFYDSVANTSQLFYRPRVDKCDGTEPSIDQLLRGVEHTELINICTNTSSNVKTSLVNYDIWNTSRNLMPPSGWQLCGTIDENAIVIDKNPWNQNDLIWRSMRNDIDSNADGGFNTNGFALDPTKKYRFSCWIKRMSSNEQYEGRLHLGILNNKYIRTFDGLYDTNAYFTTYIINTEYNINMFLANKWLFLTFYIWPNTYDPSLGTDASSGTYIYDNSINSYLNVRDSIHLSGYFYKYTDYVFDPNYTYNTSSRLRAYFYYSTKTEEYQYFYRPRVDLCDGTEPSIDMLLNGLESPNVLDGNNSYYNDYTSRINESGTLTIGNIVEDVDFNMVDNVSTGTKMRLDKYNIQLYNQINEIDLHG